MTKLTVIRRIADVSSAESRSIGKRLRDLRRNPRSVRAAVVVAAGRGAPLPCRSAALDLVIPLRSFNNHASHLCKTAARFILAAVLHS